MTAPKTQIQALIHKIDEVLQSKPPLNSSQPMNDVQQQQVLEQARQYLSSLQSEENAPVAGIPEERRAVAGEASPALPNFGQSSFTSAMQQSTGVLANQGFSSAAPAESAQQVLQAVVQEMNYLRVNMMQPLREELMTLYQQRQLVTADIQRLEQQRQDLLLANQQLNQQQLVQTFMQSLTDKLQEQLAAQIAQTYSNLELQATQLPPGALGDGEEHTQLSPGQRLLYMQKLQEQSDDMLLRLDATLRVVFDSLQTNVEGYHESLIHGLEKLRGLGKQGEALMAALLNRFAEQVGRGAASHYLQSSPHKEWELPGLGSVEGPNSGGIARQPVRSKEQVAVPDKLPEEQLDRLINTLDDSTPAHGDSRELENLTLSDSPVDDALIDELLGTLKADGTADEVAFNLNDVELPIDEVSLPPLESGESEPEPPSQPREDSSSSGSLTLFEIEDDGVRVHLESDRLDQLRDEETDSFLNDLDVLTQQNTSSSASFTPDNPLAADEDADASFPSSSSVDDDDEALAFLDEIATQVEDELSFIPTESEGQSPENAEISGEEGGSDDGDDVLAQSFAPIQKEDRRVVPDESRAVDQRVAADSAEVDSDRASLTDSSSEMDPFFELFQPSSPAAEASGVENKSPSDSDNRALDGQHPPAVQDEYPGDRPLYDVPASAASLDASSEKSISGTLGSLFEEPEGVDDESAMDALGLDSVETSTDNSDDLLADLGLVVHPTESSASENRDSSSAANIETITSLTQLIDDTEARASVESASDLSQPGNVENPFQFDDAPADRYVVASSEEDLLESDSPEQQINPKVPLDEDQRQRLAVDLANVEGLDTSEVLSSLAYEFRGSNDDDTTAMLPGSETIEGFLSPDDDFFSVDTMLGSSDVDFSSDTADTATERSVPEEATEEDSMSDEPSADGSTIDDSTAENLNSDPSSSGENWSPESSIPEASLTDLDVLDSAECTDTHHDHVHDHVSDHNDAASEEMPSGDTVEGLFDTALKSESGIQTSSPTLDDVAQAVSEAPELETVSDAEEADSLGGMMQDLFWESETNQNWDNQGFETTAEDEPASPAEPASMVENAESTVTTPQDDEFAESEDKDDTLSSLFSAVPEGPTSANEADAPDADLFSRLEESEQLEDDAELQGIFEELRSLGDDFDQEANQAQQEQTLLNLIKGVNQPSIPDDDLPSTPPESSQDFTWTVFDNMDTPDDDAASEEKKNNGF